MGVLIEGIACIHSTARSIGLHKSAYCYCSPPLHGGKLGGRVFPAASMLWQEHEAFRNTQAYMWLEFRMAAKVMGGEERCSCANMQGSVPKWRKIGVKETLALIRSGVRGTTKYKDTPYTYGQ